MTQQPLAPEIESTASLWRPRIRWVQVGPARLRVSVIGDGPPLLLANGIGANIEMWQPVVERLPGRRLVLFDMPGTGQSPPLHVPRRMRGYAAIATGLLDELGIERADVLGYSWGGALAQQLAHQAPDRVRSLVLGATMPGLGGQPPSPLVMALMATPARYYSKTYLRLASPYIFGRAGGEVDSRHSQNRVARPPSTLGYLHQLAAITGWSSRRWLSTLSVPTLVIAGSRDPLVRPRNARILARAIPGARLHIVDGGHLFLLEQPDEAVPVIEDFLLEQDARALARV
ncbi:MAG TPA: alpha/beta fold hydrolase [Mycobacteriales bacterium]|nr:alpha/beta fold hydrolase [Mycobacteriales bacterium]